MRATDNNSFTWSATGASAAFALAGGVYQPAAHSANWNGGNIQLQALMPDGATWVNVGSAFSSDSINTVTSPYYLPPGQYRWNVTTTTAGVAFISRVPFE